MNTIFLEGLMKISVTLELKREPDWHNLVYQWKGLTLNCHEYMSHESHQTIWEIQKNRSPVLESLKIW